MQHIQQHIYGVEHIRAFLESCPDKADDADAVMTIYLPGHGNASERSAWQRKDTSPA
jgi:hypothetical protein